MIIFVVKTPFSLLNWTFPDINTQNLKQKCSYSLTECDLIKNPDARLHSDCRDPKRQEVLPKVGTGHGVHTCCSWRTHKSSPGSEGAQSACWVSSASSWLLFRSRVWTESRLRSPHHSHTVAPPLGSGRDPAERETLESSLNASRGGVRKLLAFSGHPQNNHEEGQDVYVLRHKLWVFRGVRWAFPPPRASPSIRRVHSWTRAHVGVYLCRRCRGLQFRASWAPVLMANSCHPFPVCVGMDPRWDAVIIQYARICLALTKHVRPHCSFSFIWSWHEALSVAAFIQRLLWRIGSFRAVFWVLDISIL